jgi:phospholipase C
MDDDDGFNFTNVMNLFANTHISWKTYVETHSVEFSWKPDPDGRNLNYAHAKQFGNFNPLPGFKSIRDNPARMAWLVPLDQYFEDLRQHTLPDVSWVIPGASSGHPPGSIVRGMLYVTTVVNGLMNSP